MAGRRGSTEAQPGEPSDGLQQVPEVSGGREVLVLGGVANRLDAVCRVQRPDHGAFVEGISLEGGAWDLKGGCLRRQDPKVLVVELPVIEIVPVEPELDVPELNTSTPLTPFAPALALRIVMAPLVDDVP